MRSGRCLRGVVAAGVAIGGWVALDSATGSLGFTTSAEAKEFFTRKRINGQWVTGVFPTENEPSTRSHSRARSVYRAKPAVARSHARVRKPGVAAPVAAATAATSAAIAVADLTSPSSALIASPSVPASSPTVRDGVSAGPATASLEGGDARLARLRSALEVRAQELASSPAPVSARFTSATDAAVTATAPVPVPVAPARPETAAANAPEPARPAAPLEPKSVSFDFETGVKTTTFSNSVVREPFDVAALKRLAVPAR
jgi:hypothetical protein